MRCALVLGLAPLGALAGGCETSRTRASHDRPAATIGLDGGLDGGYETTLGTPIDRGHRGGDSAQFSGGRQGGAADVVFASPRVQHYYIAISPETMAELTRRDPELSIYDPAHVSAIENEWPVTARPDLSRERTGRTQPYSDRGFIYYELERD